MTDELSPNHRPSRPIPALRISFWGVQGSCPIFPTPFGVREYSRRIAVDALQRTLAAIHDQRRSVEDLLGGPPTPENIAAYQQRIGLPDLPFYGGETTCVQVETAEGNILVLDAGSGIRRCSLEIVQAWAGRRDRTLHILGSHEHLDHRSGLTFSRFCYDRQNPFTLRIYGSWQFLESLDHHYAMFSRELGPSAHVDDPVDYTHMSANFIGAELARAGEPAPGQRYWDVRDADEPIRIGQTVITPFEVYHAATRCLAYKIQHGGRTFVFCTDHELRHGRAGELQQRSQQAEQRLREHCRDADLLYIDGQYFMEEYLGHKPIGESPAVPRIDWGHGCIEDILARSEQCGVKRTLVGHHDPERSWQERVDLDHQLARHSQGKPCQIQLADSDVVIDV